MPLPYMPGQPCSHHDRFLQPGMCCPADAGARTLVSWFLHTTTTLQRKEKFNTPTRVQKRMPPRSCGSGTYRRALGTICVATLLA